MTTWTSNRLTALHLVEHRLDCLRLTPAGINLVLRHLGWAVP